MPGAGMIRVGPAGSPQRGLSPQGRWARASGVGLSVCVHAAIVLLLIIGLTDHDLRLGGGGGGGSSGAGGGLGEGAVMVALPASMTLAASPDPTEDAQPDSPAPLLEPLPDASERLETAETLPLTAVAQPEVATLPTPISAPVLETKPPVADAQPLVSAPPPPEEAPSLELTHLAPPPPPAQPAPVQPLVAAAPPPEAPSPEQPVSDPLAEAPATEVLETDLLQSETLASDEPAELALKSQEELKPLAGARPPSETLAEAPEDLLEADEVRESPIEEEPLQDLPMEELAEPLQVEPTTEMLDTAGEELAESETEPLTLTDEALPTDLLATQAGTLSPSESEEVALQAALIAIPELEEERQEVALALREIALETEAQRPEESEGMIVPPSKPTREVTLPEIPKPKQVVAQATRQQTSRQQESRGEEKRETRMAAVSSAEADQQVMGRQAEQGGKGQSLDDGGGEQGRPGTGGQGAAGAGAGPSGAEASGYADRIAAWLERHKRYPRISRRMGEQGVVTLQFTLDGEGRVLGQRILQSSGHDRLDQEVLALLERASPMPRPPGNAGRISLAVPIVFSLR